MDSSVTKLNRPPPVTTATGPRDKVRTLGEVAQIAAQLRQFGKTVV
jgi:hypothetical protein